MPLLRLLENVDRRGQLAGLAQRNGMDVGVTRDFGRELRGMRELVQRFGQTVLPHERQAERLVRLRAIGRKSECFAQYLLSFGLPALPPIEIGKIDARRDERRLTLDCSL